MASYREVARVAGDKAWTATQPFPVRVVPADLVRQTASIGRQAAARDPRAADRRYRRHHRASSAQAPS